MIGRPVSTALAPDSALALAAGRNPDQAVLAAREMAEVYGSRSISPAQEMPAREALPNWPCCRGRKGRIASLYWNELRFSRRPGRMRPPRRLAMERVFSRLSLGLDRMLLPRACWAAGAGREGPDGPQVSCGGGRPGEPGRNRSLEPRALERVPSGGGQLFRGAHGGSLNAQGSPKRPRQPCPGPGQNVGSGDPCRPEAQQDHFSAAGRDGNRGGQEGRACGQRGTTCRQPLRPPTCGWRPSHAGAGQRAGAGPAAGGSGETEPTGRVSSGRQSGGGAGRSGGGRQARGPGRRTGKTDQRTGEDARFRVSSQSRGGRRAAAPARAGRTPGIRGRA